jgi:hypothetical protein
MLGDTLSLASSGIFLMSLASMRCRDAEIVDALLSALALARSCAASVLLALLDLIVFIMHHHTQSCNDDNYEWLP